MAGFSVSFWEHKLQDADLFTKEAGRKAETHSNTPGWAWAEAWDSISLNIGFYASIKAVFHCTLPPLYFHEHQPLITSHWKSSHMDSHMAM